MLCTAHPTTSNGYTEARVRLAAMKGVTLIDNPLPRQPEVKTDIIAGIRYYSVKAGPDGFSAALHLRLGEWIALAAKRSEEAALDAVAQHIALVAHTKPWHDNDGIERAAARQVLAGL